jgi:proteasome assembly chaperone (PAC2) family protein
VAVSTSSSLLNQALKSKALRSSAGNPIVGTAGILLGLAKLRKMEAICLLGETRGYLPDPEAAKSVVEVLGKMFGIKVDISELHKDIEKSKEIVERMQEIEKRREKYAQKMRRVEEERITYIS